MRRSAIQYIPDMRETEQQEDGDNCNEEKEDFSRKSTWKKIGVNFKVGGHY